MYTLQNCAFVGVTRTLMYHIAWNKQCESCMN